MTAASSILRACPSTPYLGDPCSSSNFSSCILRKEVTASKELVARKLPPKAVPNSGSTVFMDCETATHATAGPMHSSAVRQIVDGHFHCKRGNFPNKLQAHIFERSLLFLI